LKPGTGRWECFLDQNDSRNVLWTASVSFNLQNPGLSTDAAQASIVRFDLSSFPSTEIDVSHLQLDDTHDTWC
jgi:hypothetical protein